MPVPAWVVVAVQRYGDDWRAAAKPVPHGFWRRRGHPDGRPFTEAERKTLVRHLRAGTVQPEAVSAGRGQPPAEGQPRQVSAASEGQPPEPPARRPVVVETPPTPPPANRPLRPRTHLVIGDAHAKPGQDLSRFTWLGRMIAELRPDVVVNIGDWTDMPSLSSYDIGKRCYEGRRYEADIGAGREGQRLLHREIDDIPGYRPLLVAVGGNHDFARIDRLTNDLPQLQGAVGVQDLGWAERGWLQVPFLHPFTIDGCTYAHYFVSGVMGRAIGGVNPGRAMLMAQHSTVIAGHSHLLSHASLTTATGSRIHGLQVGCYFDEEEGYAGPANALWWRGIVVLRDVRDGDFDLETWSMGRIRRRWGSA